MHRTFAVDLGIFWGTSVMVLLNFGNDLVEVLRVQMTGAVRWAEGWEEWVWAFEGGCQCFLLSHTMLD
jgi:hypothetical protein